MRASSSSHQRASTKGSFSLLASFLGSRALDILSPFVSRSRAGSQVEPAPCELAPSHVGSHSMGGVPCIRIRMLSSGKSLSAQNTHRVAPNRASVA